MNVEERVEAYLQKLDLNPTDRGNYWVMRCPHPENHNNGDRLPSAQCFKDGWIQCHSGCGRFHINHVAKERGDPAPMPQYYAYQTAENALERASTVKKVEKVVRGNFTSLWLNLEPLGANTEVKGVPAIELNKRGWRKFDGGNGLRPGIFIPYFDIKRNCVPFFQIRHLTGERRFTFAPGITPMCYGMEMLPKCKDYVAFTEGSRDSVILGMAGVPAIALPSASSAKLIEGLCNYCIKERKKLVCIGDRDDAGETLVESICIPFLDYRTPVGKDVGEFYAEKGLEAIKKYYARFIVEGVASA